MKETVQGLVNAFTDLDKVREQMNAELVKAANQALGADLFINADFYRHTQGVEIILKARIPVENPLGFWD
ncbi:MAG: hypothetical protein LBD55_09080 [Treponema sp.]|jgi:hypothetical protein|nr:hypothetical protein [Treponema sp.]